jgi:hypothetical protein
VNKQQIASIVDRIEILLVETEDVIATIIKKREGLRNDIPHQ